MKIYISIPITGHDPEEQQAKAAKFAEAIKALGHKPVNPFDTPAAPSHLDEREEYAYYIGEDLKEMLRCDAVYFSEGWNRSKGCTLEHFAAEIYGLKIFYSHDKIPKAE